MKKVAVIAIGGNAIIQADEKGTLEEQFNNILGACDPIIDLIEEGYTVVLAHGNGPHVGNALLKVEAASKKIPPITLDICGAETQGSIGYMIQQCVYNRMRKRNISKNIATIVTQVVVDKNDSAFQNPTKPIGPFYTKERAEEILKEKDIDIIEDSGRGYRQVVASPEPLEIIEKDAIKTLVEQDFVVITIGGGGIPVIRENGNLKGIEAVIDKDRASALLAEEIDADYLILLTAVEQVAINYNTDNQRSLDRLSVSEAEEYLKAGQFPPGNMGPKIQSAIKFVKNSEGEAIITSIDKLQEAIKGKTGTRIIK
ncbi:MAG: carbamate kinase [Clostridiales bacterium]|nr:carbamate kinase [Clostridiales bacterium]